MLPSQVHNTIAVKTCPKCGHRSLQSLNVHEHKGIDGMFLSYQLYCLRCDEVIGSATSPKDISITPEEKTTRERKTPRARTRKPTTQKGLFS